MKWTNVVSRRIFSIAIFFSLLTSVRCQQIVDRSVIKDGGKFTLTCDANHAGVPIDSQTIARIELGRKLPSQTSYSDLAQYLAYAPPHVRKEIQNTSNPSWQFIFTGARDGTNNRAMAIRVLVSQAKCSDAGLYKCEVDYFLHGLWTKKREQMVTSEVRCQQIVDRSVIKDGGTFTLTCNADRAGVPIDSQTIARIELGRKLPSQTSYSDLAQYLAYAPPYARKEIQNTSDPSWQFTFTGARDGTNNRAMAIRVLVSQAKCSDAGLYKCEVDYFLQSLWTKKREQMVTSEVRTHNLAFYWDPDNSTFPYPYYSQHKEGENIVINCRVDGPRHLRLKWMKGIRQALSQSGDRVFSDYNHSNGIIEGSTPVACAVYNHASVLRLKLQAVDDDTMYKCAVMDNGQEVMSRNLTIGITQTVAPTIPLAKEQRKILKKNGQELTVTCDASRLLLDADITDIAMLEIGRRTNIDSGYQIIAQYRAFGPARNREAKSIPSDRNRWQVSMSGVGNGTHNRHAMRLIWTLLGFRAEDAGTYYCTLLYTRAGLVTLFTEEIFEAAV